MQATPADNLDDFSETWASDPDKYWISTLKEGWSHPLDDTPLNIGDDYALLSDEDSEEEDSEDTEAQVEVVRYEYDDDLIQKRSCRRIDEAARSCPIYQGSAVKLSKQCWVLVKSFMLWKETRSKLISKSEEARARDDYNLIRRASEISLRRDLKRISTLLESLRDYSAISCKNIDHDRCHRIFLNAIKFLLFPRPFFLYSERLVFAIEETMHMQTQIDLALHTWKRLKEAKNERGQPDIHIGPRSISTAPPAGSKPRHKELVKQLDRRETSSIKLGDEHANTSDSKGLIFDMQPVLTLIKTRMESVVACLQRDNTAAEKVFRISRLTQCQLATEMQLARTGIDQHPDKTSILREANDLLVLKVELLEKALGLFPSSKSSCILSGEAPSGSKAPESSSNSTLIPPPGGLECETEEALFKVVYITHFLQTGPSMPPEEMSPLLHCLIVALKDMRWFDEAADVLALQLTNNCAIQQKMLSESNTNPDKFLSGYWCSDLQREASRVVEETVAQYRVLQNTFPTASNLAPIESANQLSYCQTKSSQAGLLQIAEDEADWPQDLVDLYHAWFIPETRRPLSPVLGSLREGARPYNTSRPSHEIAGLSRPLTQVHPLDVTPSLVPGAEVYSFQNRPGGKDLPPKSGEGITVMEQTFIQGCTAPLQDEVALPIGPLLFCLTGLGRSDAALQAQCQVVRSFQKLAFYDPFQYESPLARALDSLSTHFRRVGCKRHALQASEEAVRVHRKFFSRHPGHQLASSLTIFVFHLCDVDRSDEALEASKEVAQLYRTLTQPVPGALQPNLASSLCLQSLCLSRSSHHKDALLAVEEAIALYQTMVDSGEEAFKPSLAQAMDCRECCVALKPVELGMVRE